MRLNVSTGVPTVVTAFWSDRWIIGFEVEVEVEDNFGWYTFLNVLVK